MVVSMDRWENEVAVVTGASSGIGYAIAVALVMHGLRVVGLARRLDRLKDLEQKLQGAKGQFIPAYGDITNETQVVELFSWIEQNVGPIAVMVNNAGVAPFGTLNDGDYANWDLILRTNVLGGLTCAREAIRQMNTANKTGQIIFINSLVGHKVPDKLIKGMGIYPASKYAVTAITEGLRLELGEKKSKIKVSSISPGLVETELSTLRNDIPEEVRAYLASLPIMKPEDIADGVVYALSTPENVQVAELTLTNVPSLF